MSADAPTRLVQADRDADARVYLWRLLALIHADGGQHTRLVGLRRSVLDAEATIVHERARYAADVLFARREIERLEGGG